MTPTDPERRPATPRERFARAVDQPRPAEPGAEFGTELAIVAELRRTPTPGPDAATRQRIYERVRHDLGSTLPVPAPRIPEHEEQPARPTRPARRTPAATAPPGRADATRPGRAHGLRRRLAVSVAAALSMFAVLGGLSMLLARDALPGDALYNVRRMTEQAAAQMTPDPTERATMQLGYASERLRDMAALRSAGAGPRDFRIAFDDFDADAAAGARILTSLGTSASTRSFSELSDWVRGTARQLDAIAGRLPAGLVDRVRASTTLLHDIDGRVQTLRARLDCASVTDGTSDGIGPLPASSHDCARLDAGHQRGPQLTNQPTPANRASTTDEARPSEQPQRQRPSGSSPAPSRQKPPAASTKPTNPLQRPLLPPITGPASPDKPSKHRPIITLTPLPGLPGISIG